MADIPVEELIIKRLLEGKTQSEISKILKESGVRPNSLSFVEKALKKIKRDNKAKTMFHLGAILAVKKYFNRV